jgi:cobalt-zinc-cadmium efflux system protein
MPQGHADDVFLKHATDLLHDNFDITHVTLQVMNEAFTTACAPVIVVANR